MSFTLHRRNRRKESAKGEYASSRNLPHREKSRLMFPAPSNSIKGTYFNLNMKERFGRSVIYSLSKPRRQYYSHDRRCVRDGARGRQYLFARYDTLHTVDVSGIPRNLVQILSRRGLHRRPPPFTHTVISFNHRSIGTTAMQANFSA